MSELNGATGSCLCEKIRFEFDFPSKWCGHCYCKMCRKAHGAGFVTWIGVPESAFRLTAGQDHLKTFASSPGAKRKFCDTCGASMFFESEKWPGEVHIAMACVDSPADREPEGNAFFDEKAHWIELQTVKKTPA